MTSPIKLFFEGGAEVLEIVDTGKQLIKYLLEKNELCPLMGSEIQFGGKLGEGNNAKVFIVKLKGMGKKEYVAKMPNFTFTAITTPEKLAEYREAWEESNMFSNEETTKLLNQKFKKEKGELIIVSFLEICRTSEEFVFDRLDGNGVTIIPKGSYICTDIYSEYYLAMLAASFYRSGESVHFLDTFNFATCFQNAKIKQYIFMEKADTDVRSISKCIFDPTIPELASALLIQIYAALTVLEKYKINHYDLHDLNVFIEYVTKNSEYRGQKLEGALFYSYDIYGTQITIPAIPILAKVADFGLGVKWSEPIIGDMTSIRSEYVEDVVPNWYAPGYDVYLITHIFFKNNPKNDFIRRVSCWILGLDLDTSAKKVMKAYGKVSQELYDTRIKVDLIETKLVEVTATHILQNKELMGMFHLKPSEEKIVNLGTVKH